MDPRTKAPFWATSITPDRSVLISDSEESTLPTEKLELLAQVHYLQDSVYFTITAVGLIEIDSFESKKYTYELNVMEEMIHELKKKLHYYFLNELFKANVEVKLKNSRTDKHRPDISIKFGDVNKEKCKSKLYQNAEAIIRFAKPECSVEEMTGVQKSLERRKSSRATLERKKSNHKVAAEHKSRCNLI